MNQPVENTDKELWRETPYDYYSPSIFVTEHNKIGINVGGMVYVKSVEDWHRMTREIEQLKAMNVKLREIIEKSIDMNNALARL